MPSRFESRFLAHAIPVIEREHSVDVVMYRGPLVTATFQARRDTIYSQSLGQEIGIEVKTVSRDWLLPIASVVIDGQEVEPVAGDRIVEIDSGQEWEVHHPDNSTPAAELETGATDWLAHTKRVTDGETDTGAHQ